MLIRIALALLALALPGLAPAAGNVAGTVDLVEGEVRVTGADKTTRTPAFGDTLSESDTVETGRDGELHAKMQDGGYLAIRPASKVLIQRYQANGEASDTSILSLLQGGFRSITGWIGRVNPKGYQVKAGVATIGIRGTDHEPHFRLAGDAEGEAGVYDRVNAGGTFIDTEHGRVDVAPGKAGYWNHTLRERPRVLDRMPGFFRATRNEKRLEGLHERLQPLLEQRREERRNFLREHPEAAPAARLKNAAQARAAGDKAAQAKAAGDKSALAATPGDKAMQAGTPAEKAAQAKAAREKAATERAEKAKAAREKVATERAEKMKAAREKTATDKAAREKTATDKAAREKAMHEKAPHEKAGAAKAGHAPAAHAPAAHPKPAHENAAAQRAERQDSRREQLKNAREAKGKPAEDKPAAP